MNANKNNTVSPLDDFTMDVNNSRDYSASLQELSRMIAYAVVKRLHSVSGSNVIASFRRDIANAKNTFNKLSYTSNKAFSIVYDENGDACNYVEDVEEAENFMRIIHTETINDGFDLVQTASLAILEEISAQLAREPGEAVDLERPYTIRKLDRRVIIRKGDSAKWIEKETTPIQEIFRKVRKTIEDERRSPVSLESVYQYIPLDEYGEAMEDGEAMEEAIEEHVYKRLPKYSVLGDYETDFNGKQTVVTASGEDVKTIDSIIEKLSLSSQQKAILTLRLRGYGKKAIASYFGITDGNVLNQLNRIRKKALDAGLLPDGMIID